MSGFTWIWRKKVWKTEIYLQKYPILNYGDAMYMESCKKNHYFWGYCAWHWGMFRNNLESNLIKSTILSFNKYWNLSKSDQRQKFSITKQHISYKQNAQACQISHYSNNFKCIALWFDNLFNRENKQLFFQKVVFVVPNHFLCLT